MKFLKINLTALFIFIPFFFLSQLRQETKTASLLQFADYYIGRDEEKALKYAKSALLLSKKNNETSKEVRAYIYIAHTLAFLNNTRSSLYYSEIASKMSNDKLLKMQVSDIKAINYSRLGYDDLELKEYNKILNDARLTKGDESTILEAKTYQGMSIYYSNTAKNNEAILKFIDKSISLINKIPSKNYRNLKRLYKCKTSILLSKAEVNLSYKKGDSTEYYLKKALSQAKEDSIYYTEPIYTTFAELYKQKNDLLRSEHFFLKALDEMLLYGDNNSGAYKYIYSELAKIYGKNGNYAKSNRYFIAYNQMDDQVSIENQTQNQQSVNYLLDELKHQKRIASNYFKYLIGCITIIFLNILCFILIKANKIKKIKRNIINEQKVRLGSMREELSLVINEKINLEKQSIVGMEELLESAKNNSPDFASKFYKMHPDFVTKLLLINNDLKKTEINLCAYIYLEFSTKEIAEYTFKALQTVKNNKYNLRKRLNIPPKQDMVVWIKEQIAE